MRISEALQVIRKGPPDAPPFTGLLACGCAPLHLKTFLHAHLQQRLPQRRVSVAEGLYGDLAGTLERAASQPLHGAAVVIEWADLDARLGYRSAGQWGRSAIEDILRNAGAMLERIGAALENLDRGVRVALALPGLPLPPMFATHGRQAAGAELELERLVASFAALVARRSGLAVLHAGRLAEESPAGARLDLKSDLLIGFPYTVEHAGVLASLCAGVLAPEEPKKGVITDLDDTLWDGLVGEVGASGVSWDLNGHSQMHALYQKLLASLAGRGVLVGVASKNDSAVVDQVFSRSDLLLSPDQVFPMEVHWQAKSGSVSRILETWNIAADSVIFVDDSPMELAEVQAAHPGIHCLRFPKGDYEAGLAMLCEIRDLCGKERVSEEDALRLDSIRRGAEFRTMAAGGLAPDSFLEQIGAVVTLDFAPSPEDVRVLELVNKTNQFNLNGVRRTEADWRQEKRSPAGVVAVVSYEDKFGPLGKIAVLQGCRSGDTLHLKTWVMSCRAFSRRVEHQCLRVFFDRFGLEEIRFEIAVTAKNGPLREFFAGFLGAEPEGPATISRQGFEALCPKLFQRVVIAGEG